MGSLKHVFFVHSHITFIVSLNVIEYEKLKKEDCVFIIHRGKIQDYTNIGVKTTIFPFDPYPVDCFYTSYRFWKSWDRIKQLDNYLAKITENNQFVFYTPQTNLKYFALIISNKNCSQYNLIEEGVGSYVQRENFRKVQPFSKSTLKQRVVWKLNFLDRLKQNRDFNGDGYNKAYGLTQYSFNGFTRKVVVDNKPTVFDEQAEGIATKNAEYKNVLVFDSIADTGSTNVESLMLSTLFLLNRLIQEGETTLHIKYHPDQFRVNKSISKIKGLLFLYKDKIEIIELSPEISLEGLAFNSKATFYVFVSSVGLYALLFGRKVYSLAKILEYFDPGFNVMIDYMPNVYKEKVKFLQF